MKIKAFLDRHYSGKMGVRLVQGIDKNGITALAATIKPHSSKNVVLVGSALVPHLRSVSEADLFCCKYPPIF